MRSIKKEQTIVFNGCQPSAQRYDGNDASPKTFTKDDFHLPALSNLSLTPVMMRKKFMKFCNLKKVQYLESKRVLRKGGARYRICVEKTVLDRREWCLILGWKDGENTFVSAITPSPRHYWQEIYDHTSSHNALPSQIALVNYPYISQFLNLSSWMS